MGTVTTELKITNGNREIYGKLYMPKKEGKYPAIILCHGYNGTHDYWENECSHYASYGYIAYAFDFCGGSVNSKSTGNSTDMTITSEKEDLFMVFDYIKAMDNVDSSNIVLFGGSQGGLVSALAAAERAEEVKALAMYYPAFCIPDNWGERFENPDDAPEKFDFWGLELGREFIKDVKNIDVFNAIGNYKGNVLIIHGNEDDIVPFSYSMRAAEVYEHAELVKMENEGHGFSEYGGVKAQETVLGFLERECKKKSI